MVVCFYVLALDPKKKGRRKVIGTKEKKKKTYNNGNDGFN
jgi:hypothetical protein